MNGEGTAHLLAAIEDQCRDYRALHRAYAEQRDCLGRDDLAGSTAAEGRVRSLIDRVRRRQDRLPADLGRLAGQRQGLGAAVAVLRQLVEAAVEAHHQSQVAARLLLEDTRQQVRRFDAGRRAGRGYRRPAVQEARFVDRRR